MRIYRRMLLVALVGVPLLTIAYKLVVRGYDLADVLPRHRYDVAVSMHLDGHGSRARARMLVPQSDDRQTITVTGTSASPGLALRTESQGANRVAVWSGANVADGSSVDYRFSVLSKPQRYVLGDDLEVPGMYPESLRTYLEADDNVQVDHPEIQAELVTLGADHGPLTARVRRIYDHTAGLGRRPFKGTTDALTALRLGEASCNGKSRLMVALARAAGVPARLVGGLIMRAGSKRTSHQWVELYIAGHWVPFDPTNRHFASIPESYLVLYRGDHALFRHTSDINFDYRFTTATEMVPSPRARSSFGSFNLWALFERLGLPFNLLRTILMLPVGALIVVLFRNVIGMPTFGTFLPALIAAAAGTTGLGWGLVSVLLVMGVVSLARWGMQRLGLLHSPTLAILLSVVVITMLVSSLLAERAGLDQLARVSFFPIAVMAIASERFYLALAEQGRRQALAHLAGTLLVVSACSVVMNSLALQILLSSFPEILLLVIAANVFLGRWIGVRVFEYVRFRHVLLEGAAR